MGPSGTQIGVNLLRYYMSKMVREILMNLAMMYLLDMGKVSFVHLCIMNLLHMLRALIILFVDEITLIILDLRQTTFNEYSLVYPCL